MKSKILIILLCVVAAIFLISGCFFYNTIYITFPLAATYIAIMVSNYALVMFGLAVILHYDGSTTYNKCALYRGVLAGGISFFCFSPVRLYYFLFGTKSQWRLACYGSH